jgi:hypothetical protein
MYLLVLQHICATSALPVLTKNASEYFSLGFENTPFQMAENKHS